MTERQPCPGAAQLQALLDGTHTQAEQDRLNHHVEECQSCQRTLEQLAATSWEQKARQFGPQESAPQILQELIREAQSHGISSATQPVGQATSALPDSGSGIRDNSGNASGTLTSSDTPDLSYLAPPAHTGHLGRLHHYEILEIIGKGGFGTVFKARDEKLDRLVAVKVLTPALAGNATARRRFIREAKAAAALRNDHVIAIHGVDDAGPVPYLVMELIAGVSLQEKLDASGPLEVKEILRIGMQTALGLAAAHQVGLVHRDIKPANILLENGVERVKITDFGLARAVDDASVTQSGTVAGTPMYMSPEQAEGLAIDHRSDLFSLGTVLYTMCTGHPPFRASGTHAVLKRVIEAAPRPIREVNSEIPEWLEAIIAKLHAKKPEDRFQTANEVGDLLGQHLAHLQQPNAVPLPAMVAVSPRSEPVPPAEDTHGAEAEATFPVRLMPRDIVDVSLLVLLTPFVIALFLVLPFLLISWLAARTGLGAWSGLVGVLGGLAFLYAVFFFLGLRAAQRAIVSRRGIELVRDAGAPITIPWSSLRGIEEATRWEVFRRVWLWPGFTPRGSIMGMSALHHFRIEWEGSCYYFAPADPDAFRKAIAHYQAQALAPPVMLSVASSATPPPHPALSRGGGEGGVRGSWQIGDRVLAPWEPEWLYVGTVQQTSEDSVHVAFDDGDSAWVKTAQVRPLALEAGIRVFAWWNELCYHPATVTDQRGNQVHVTFDDGESAWTELYCIRVSAGKPAMPALGTWNAPSEAECRRAGEILAPTVRLGLLRLRQAALVGGAIGAALGFGLGLTDPTLVGMTDPSAWLGEHVALVSLLQGAVIGAALGTLVGLARWLLLVRVSWEIRNGLRTAAGQRGPRPAMTPQVKWTCFGLVLAFFAPILVLIFVLLAGSNSPPKSDSGANPAPSFVPVFGGPGWKRLYDGKSTNGWKSVGNFHADGGALVLSPGAALDTNDIMPRNFHLRMEVKLSHGQGMLRFHAPARNAQSGEPLPVGGWFLRFSESPNVKDRVDAQLGIDIPTKGGVTGLKGLTHAFQVARLGEWFYVEISSTDQLTEILVNSKTAISAEHAKYPPPTPGVIVLWNASMAPADRQIAFRNIEIKDLTPPPEPGWVQLFDGKDLTGWKMLGEKKDWLVKDAMIIGKAGPTLDYLVTKRTDFENFHLRVEAKINKKGRSGVFFRCQPAATGEPLPGYEAEISSGAQHPNTGSLWHRARPPADTSVLHEEDKVLAPPDSWFTLEIIADGNRLVTKVNGHKVANVIDNNFRSGQIALQLWGEKTQAQFKKIEIKELPPAGVKK
jgi:tRNA A-37 threonylcarbamoyl transferase component Bud32